MVSICIMMSAFIETTIPVLQLVWDSAKFYLFWSSLHFLAINSYQYFCAEWSIWGYLSSSINSQMPLCKSIKWVGDISIKTLDSYWALMIACAVGKMTGVFGGVSLIATGKT